MDIFELIKEKVSMFDLFDELGWKYISRDKSAKIHCTFHGVDKNKSGYVYHDTDTYRCFVCDRSWDVISFWAQANEWFKEKDGEFILDIGRSIADLKERYSIEYVRPEWQDVYFKLRGKVGQPHKNYDTLPLREREKLRDYYVWKAGCSMSLLNKEQRSSLWTTVEALWDQLSAIDLSKDSWKEDLNSWQKSAKIIS